MQRECRLTWRRVLTGLTVLVMVWQLGLAVILYGKHNWSAIRFEYPVDYGEGPLLDQAVRMARFENIYRSEVSRPPTRSQITRLCLFYSRYHSSAPLARLCGMDDSFPL